MGKCDRCVCLTTGESQEGTKRVFKGKDRDR